MHNTLNIGLPKFPNGPQVHSKENIKTVASGNIVINHSNNLKFTILTANLSPGGKLSQISGAISVPKISAVPVRRRRRRGESGLTSILSSHSLSSFTCLMPDGPPATAADGGATAEPPNAMIELLALGESRDFARVSRVVAWTREREFGRAQ